MVSPHSVHISILIVSEITGSGFVIIIIVVVITPPPPPSAYYIRIVSTLQINVVIVIRTSHRILSAHG